MMLQADNTETVDSASLHFPNPTTGSLEQGSRDFHTHYSMKEEIGRGGFGTIFAAVRHKDGLEVAMREAVKNRKVVMGPAGKPLEVALLLQVQEMPGVISLIYYFDGPESFYIVMEKLDGADLFNFISEMGPLPKAMTKGLFRQLLTTVIGCHQRGVVHRDIKDKNILLDLNTQADQLRLQRITGEEQAVS